jgi:hypothetical protein
MIIESRRRLSQNVEVLGNLRIFKSVVNILFRQWLRPTIWALSISAPPATSRNYLWASSLSALPLLDRSPSKAPVTADSKARKTTHSQQPIDRRRMNPEMLR